jgi:hypothetical protein
MERGKFKSDCLVADIDIKNNYKLCSQIWNHIAINGIHGVNWYLDLKNRRKVINHYLKVILRGQILGIKKGGLCVANPHLMRNSGSPDHL